MTWARGGEEVTGTLRRHWAGKGMAGWVGFLLSCWVTLGKLSLLQKTSIQTSSWSEVLGLVKESAPLYQIPVPCQTSAVQVSDR